MSDSGWQTGSVVVVGGGLAGLAAGSALAEAGLRVTLLEQRPYVGGRASSYQHPGTGEVVDNCQHVLLGCCTNLIRFYERIGVADKIRWFEELTFIEPGGRRSRIKSSALPAPLHNLPSFLAAKSLSMYDKMKIAQAMLAMRHGPPDDSNESFAQWLRRNGQTQRSAEHFWKPILVSALNEDLGRISIRYAIQVFRESFLKSREAGRMGVPTIPLSDLYGTAADYIRARGGEVRLRDQAMAFAANSESVTVTTADAAVSADFAVLAVPFDVLRRLLPQSSRNGVAELQSKLEQLEHSPITGIHLWFDRQISSCEHAVLLDRTIQWMFHKSMLHGNNQAQGSYVELVVSSSKSLVEKSRAEIIALALKELADFFPEVNGARLLKATVIKEVKATYSVQPLSDQYRLASATPWPQVFLAGDWTATGWPATMEGAVRSGYKAAELIMRAIKKPKSFLVPDLAARGIMRLWTE